MTILATGDHHFEHGPRWDECIRVHSWIAERVEADRPALFLSAGDLYERASTPVERAAVAEWLTRVADVCPVIMVKGNHDRSRDLELLGRLRTRHPVIVEERAGVHVVAGVAVAAVAWPSRAMLAAALGEHASPETVAQEGREALRNVLRGLGAELARHDGPRVLLAHAHVVGARVGIHGQPLAAGAEVTVGLEDLALAESDAVVLGHIHAAQEWSFGGVPMAYTGSPFRNTFGEAEEKSILSIEIHEPTTIEPMRASFLRIPTPCRPMLLIGARMVGLESPETGESFRGLEVDRNPEDHELVGAEIRLRYEVSRDEREAGKREADAWRAGWLGRGAASVKVEEVVLASTRARAPEVAAAKSVREMLERHWASKGETLFPERLEARARLLAEIEEASAS